MSPNIYPQNKKGFTLIEVIVSITILIFILAVGFFLVIDFNRLSGLAEEKNKVISILQRARSKALANINENSHGVYFGQDKIFLFEGPSFNQATQKIDFEKNPNIVYSGITEVVFFPLSATTTISGDNLILREKNGTKEAIISINYEGRIYQK